MFDKPTSLRVSSDLTPKDPQSNIDLDTNLLRQVQNTGKPSLRIWQNPKCLVATKPMAKRREFSDAVRNSEKRGWSVAIRQSGGACVFHGPSVLNVSVAAPFPQPFRPDDAYMCFYHLLVQRLNGFASDIDIGRVPNAYCDGAHNLVVRGRKLAGTAMRTSRQEGVVFALTHASVNLFPAPPSALRALDAFESELFGKVVQRSKQHVTSLSELCPDLSMNTEAFKSALMGRLLS